MAYAEGDCRGMLNRLFGKCLIVSINVKNQFTKCGGFFCCFLAFELSELIQILFDGFNSKADVPVKRPLIKWNFS